MRKIYLLNRILIYYKWKFFKNINYKSRRNSKSFSWYSIYDNIRTFGLNNLFKRCLIRRSHHLYIDGTFLTTKEFYQMIIYIEAIKKKVPECYI